MAIIRQDFGEIGGGNPATIVNTPYFAKNTPQTFHTDNGFFEVFHTPHGTLGDVLIQDGTLVDKYENGATISYNATTQILTITQNYTNTAYIRGGYNNLD